VVLVLSAILAGVLGPGRSGDEGMESAGLIFGIVVLVLGSIVIAVVLPGRSAARGTRGQQRDEKR
jgi:hypothetical protein